MWQRGAESGITSHPLVKDLPCKSPLWLSSRPPIMLSPDHGKQGASHFVQLLEEQTILIPRWSLCETCNACTWLPLLSMRTVGQIQEHWLLKTFIYFNQMYRKLILRSRKVCVVLLVSRRKVVHGHGKNKSFSSIIKLSTVVLTRSYNLLYPTSDDHQPMIYYTFLFWIYPSVTLWRNVA